MEFLQTPEDAEDIIQRRGRSTEPNPFLDEGWLEESYQQGKTKAIVVAGGWETRQKLTRVGKGQPLEPAFDEETGDPILHDVLTGDAATAVALIRRAADYLGIGVSVIAEPVTGPRGKVVAGQVRVRYLGKERKQRREEEE